MATTLYLIRHGETLWNADGRFQGHRNPSLNDSGRAQAEVVARALQRYPFAAVYTSDLARAAETAQIIAAPHALTPIPDARLREAFMGEWEGLTMPEIEARWPDTAAAWRRDSQTTRPTGGETLEQLQARVSAAITDIVARHADAHIAIAAHGGSLRAAIAHALGVTPAVFPRLRLDNCSVTTIRCRDGRFSLLGMNDICHLDQHPPRATWDEAGDQWRLALEGSKERVP